MTFKDIYEAIGESIDNYGHHTMSAESFYASMVDAHTAIGDLLDQDSKPMRINIAINDKTILDDIQYHIDNMIEDEEIAFPDDKARNDFEEECLDSILTTCEYDADYLPTWSEIMNSVHDKADDYGYLL